MPRFANPRPLLFPPSPSSPDSPFLGPPCWSQSTELKVQEVFIFEMAMVMSTKALAQMAAAATVDPTVDNFAEAANQLKGAASIFTALAQVQPALERQTPCVWDISFRFQRLSQAMPPSLVDGWFGQCRAQVDADLCLTMCGG